MIAVISVLIAANPGGNRFYLLALFCLARRRGVGDEQRDAGEPRPARQPNCPDVPWVVALH
jgi:hypothetical protein